MDITRFGYDFILRPFFTIVFSLYKLEVMNKEKIPQGKGAIITSNHCSFLDAPFIAWFLFPRPIHWIVAKWVWRAWYFHPTCVFSRCVPVNGSTGLAEGILKKGGIVGIFPEGCVTCDKKIKKGRKGVAVLALKTGFPIVPCYVKASLDYTKRFNIVPRFFRPVRVIFGEPIYFEKYQSGIIPEDILENSLTKILSAIDNLGVQGGMDDDKA